MSSLIRETDFGNREFEEIDTQLCVAGMRSKIPCCVSCLIVLCCVGTSKYIMGNKNQKQQRCSDEDEDANKTLTFPTAMETKVQEHHNKGNKEATNSDGNDYHPKITTETVSTFSGGPFAFIPLEMLVLILEFFTIYEVARLQRYVCVEFHDAGQKRIRERGGRKLYEEGLAFWYGLDHKTIDKDRARLLIQASCDAGCKIALVNQKMNAYNLSDEDKPKILKDLKEIATSSPYHWVDY